MAVRRSYRVYFVTHSDGRLTGILLRRWDCFFDDPEPSAYGRDEEEVLRQLEIQLAELSARREDLERYLWDESFEVRRADLSVFPQTLVKKMPVIGSKRVPLRLTYVSCRLASGAYRVMLPRFRWWMLVESLDLAAEALRNKVSAALLGEKPHWLYDFRREGEEYVQTWIPDSLKRGEKLSRADEDDDTDFEVLSSLAEELVQQAVHRQLPAVVGEIPAARQCLELALRDPPPSILLVGGEGVGKSAAVRQLARLLALRRRELGRAGVPRLWRTSAERIIAGMVYLGMWQKRCFELVEELSHEGDYLYVDHLGPMLAPQSDGASIGDLLAPAIHARSISLLAECTPAELEHHRRRNPALLDQFELVRIEPQEPATMAPLVGQYLARVLPALQVKGDGLRRLVRYLDAFIRTVRFPGKAFHFVDWLAQQEEYAGLTTLYPADVARCFSRYCGVPAELVSDDHALSVEQIAQQLQQRVIGQPDACGRCASVLARFKARINDPDLPLGTFLFVGPTGVGKTELAKQLARYLFGDERRMVRLDMSEYMTGASAQRLLEVGRGVTSLAQRVREQPLSLILLDEIEKAHPQVFDLLLGVLGEGRLTDGMGRLIDFRMTLIVMTSNLGAGSGAVVGFGDRVGADHLRQVRRHFRPEFFNRIDHVIPFANLSPADILRIVDLVLEDTRQRTGLVRRGMRLVVSRPPASTWPGSGSTPRAAPGRCDARWRSWW